LQNETTNTNFYVSLNKTKA